MFYKSEPYLKKNNEVGSTNIFILFGFLYNIGVSDKSKTYRRMTKLKNQEIINEKSNVTVYL